MMNLIILVGIFIAAHVTHGGSIDRNTSDLAKDLEEFRKTLVERLEDLPDAFFELELTMHNSDDLETEEDDPLFGDVTNFRKQLAGLAGELQEELFDIELTVNNLLVEEQEEDGTDDDDDDDDDDEEECTALWYLGMNLNPGDGHIMDFCTGWSSDRNFGEGSTYALSYDYKNQSVWEMPANYIAIVRHQHGTVDAVKVFRFSRSGISLYNRFDVTDTEFNYRAIVTSGGPIQESVAADAPYMEDDPIFSVGGDLAFNWIYRNNGHRIVMTGGHLSPEDTNDMNTHGLGNNIGCRPTSATDCMGSYNWRHEISVIQDCDYPTCSVYQVEGTDHSPDVTWYRSGPVYGNYAIYVSNGTTFPEPGFSLNQVVEQCD